MAVKKEGISCNGVDVSALRETCETVEKKPDLAHSCFWVHNTWEEGAHNRGSINAFYTAGEEHVRTHPFKIEADEAPVLLGTDKGPNPVEVLLSSLASCMTTSIIYHAAARGIEIESLESDFKGELDLRGFLNIGKNIPKGYQKIEAIFRIKTEASIEELEEFYAFSPVYTMLSKAVPIEVQIIKK